MTIDRVIAPTAPRIDKSSGGSMQSGTVASEGNSPESDPSVFSSVLTSMATDGADASSSEAALASSPADAVSMAGVPAAQASQALDPSAWLAQILGADSAVLPVPGPTLAPVSDAQVALSASAHGARALPEAGDVAASGAAGQPDTSPSIADAQSTPPRRLLAAGALRGSAAESVGGDTAARSGVIPNQAGDAGASRMDWRSNLAAQADRASFMSAPWSDSAGTGFRSLPVLRGAERQGARSVFLPLDTASPGGVASTTFSPQTASGALATATLDAPMAPGASSEAAHKVHYWITRGVQTAELQLDAFGGSAIDVSISLQGKEALVEFRTDQAEARRVLQDAMPQLRDLLRSEGLQLAGGFVGTSAGQREGDARGDKMGKTSGRVGSVVTSGLAAAERADRPGASSGHALDVFV